MNGKRGEDVDVGFGLEGRKCGGMKRVLSRLKTGSLRDRGEARVATTRKDPHHQEKKVHGTELERKVYKFCERSRNVLPEIKKGGEEGPCQPPERALVEKRKKTPIQEGKEGKHTLRRRPAMLKDLKKAEAGKEGGRKKKNLEA